MLLIAAAAAAEIQVQASRPVVVAIDGEAVGVAGTLIDTRDLPAGRHTVQVRNFMGSLLAEGTWELAEDERLRLVFDRTTRTLVALDRAPPLARAAPSVDVPPAPVQRSAPKPIPVRPDSSTASLLVTGLPEWVGDVVIAGEPVSYDAAQHGFVAYGLTPPEVAVRTRAHGEPRTDGPVALIAGAHHVCQLVSVRAAWTLDCAHTGPEQVAGRPPDAADEPSR